eukprot:COSAG02_NODE_1424_length_12684_cov_13.471116_13_plen_183_part_00
MRQWLQPSTDLRPTSCGVWRALTRRTMMNHCRSRVYGWSQPSSDLRPTKVPGLPSDRTEARLSHVERRMQLAPTWDRQAKGGTQSMRESDGQRPLTQRATGPLCYTTRDVRGSVCSSNNNCGYQSLGSTSLSICVGCSGHSLGLHDTVLSAATAGAELRVEESACRQQHQQQLWLSVVQKVE